MEIIKRGVPPGERVYTGVCRNCSTEVRFKRSKAEVHEDQRDGEFVSVCCPVCHSLIYGTEQKMKSALFSGQDWRDR